MKIKQAKEYFELGVIVGFYAIRDPLKVGYWLLVIEGKEERSWTLQTAKNEAKSFASLDTLVGEIEEIEPLSWLQRTQWARR
ncbi:hypothetical protein [Iodobacter fluviatilis]|uniref:Uncharacterized protein n=1 Tax=Iodobacter fluviatilis TaxID=537 RepID=A0A7G3GEW9_9NEIS|nr:hypothetical protein [Iodobacter fluviatilis]QBC45987.1 hypothetical protein C1H71_20745 [Iodobacter fluviatilis]